MSYRIVAGLTLLDFPRFIEKSKPKTQKKNQRNSR